MEELLAYLEQRGPLEPDQSWEGYAIILSYLKKAQQRIPTLANLKTLDRDAIDAILMREIEELASLVSELLPGGIEELEDYMPAEMKRR